MQFPDLANFPLPPLGKTGWPWTESSQPLPETMPDGHPWPRISIVTPSFNQGQFIEETIRSILLQSYPNLEYIVIDGGSSDATLDVIKKYEPWLDYWVSEPDQGQPHAINKGIDRCTGEIFNWINSDDLLMPGALQAIATAFHENDVDAVTGYVIHFNSEEISYACDLSDLSRLVRGKAPFQQPGTWLKPEGIRRVGKIDETLHYAFDLELTVRYIQAYPKTTLTAKELARFRHHETSKTVSREVHFNSEMLTIFRKFYESGHFKSVQNDLAIGIRVTEWRDILYTQAKQDSPRLSRAFNLIWRSCLDPWSRWRRTTLRVIWRILTRHTTDTIH